MDLSEKGRAVAAVVRGELRHPLMMAAPGPKKAIETLTALVEEMAHEIEVLKTRVNRHAAVLPMPLDSSEYRGG